MVSTDPFLIVPEQRVLDDKLCHDWDLLFEFKRRRAQRKSRACG